MMKEDNTFSEEALEAIKEAKTNMQGLNKQWEAVALKHQTQQTATISKRHL